MYCPVWRRPVVSAQVLINFPIILCSKRLNAKSKYHPLIAGHLHDFYRSWSVQLPSLGIHPFLQRKQKREEDEEEEEKEEEENEEDTMSSTHTRARTRACTPPPPPPG